MDTVTKGAPDKIPFGFREGSEQLRWVKKWNEAGYTLKDKQTGFGVTERYLVLNEKGNMKAVVLKASNGTDTGKRLDMGIIPTGMNHNMTSDHAGHIIVNSKYGDGENLFKVWVFNDVDDRGRLLLQENCYGAGERVSVYGDVNKEAVIVTTLNGTSISGYRWFLKDGAVVRREQFNLAGVASTPWGHVDIAPTSATSSTANYYSVFYALVNNRRGPVQYNGDNSIVNIGKPNTKKRSDADGGLADAGNWVMNACDYREFNKSKFFIHNSVNTFPWGENDFVYLIDVSGGDIGNELFPSTTSNGTMRFFASANGEEGLYGAKAAGNVGLGGNSNDVRLWVSETGFYMYAYFMFTNGYIGCVRVDCIQY